MPLSRVQQEKASVPQHSVSGVLCHSQSLKEPHFYCSFVTSPCGNAQAASLGWREQAVSVEDSQGQGSSIWSVGLVPRSPCIAPANGESLGLLQPLWTLLQYRHFPAAACLFRTGLTGRRGQGRADSSTPRSASTRSSRFPAQPFPGGKVRFSLKSWAERNDGPNPQSTHLPPLPISPGPTAIPKLQLGYKQFWGDCEPDWSQSLLKLLLYFSFWRALQHFFQK